MKHFLLWIWQLPQHLIGFVMSLIWRETVTRDVEMKDGVEHDVKFHMYPYNSVSLGDYRFIRYNSSDLTYRHELGHALGQSVYIGWFYLILVGIPSAVGNLVFRIPYIKNHFNYYHQPWERTADKKAGIER